MARNPIQIAAVWDQVQQRVDLFALANDGSMWVRSNVEIGNWKRIEQIPQFPLPSGE